MSFSTSNFTENMIERIIEMKDDRGLPMLEKYSVNSLVGILDRGKIEAIDKIYKMKEDGFNLVEFTRFFINFIPHTETQTLYLAMGLIDLFKQITHTSTCSGKVRFLDLTGYLCSVILDRRNSQNQIESKFIPAQKVISPVYQSKPYMAQPPIIYGNRAEMTHKVSLSGALVDKSKHDSLINQCFFSSTQNKVFCLQSLSQNITVYDNKCQIVKKIRPNSSKLKKDSVVLSFAYSERQERIGAILKDFSLSFWDQSENYEFQKSISTAASHCQQLQIRIWYLQYFHAWITSDKTGLISVWNLSLQIPERSFKCKLKSKINDLCQINCLNLIAVVQQGRRDMQSLMSTSRQAQTSKIVLYNFIKGEAVGQIDTRLQKRILHTVRYSQTYQVLLSAGYEKKINIFEINNKYLDSSLRGELMGHESIITSFTLVRKTPMVVSSDDKGKVKIWNIRNYKCMQTLDFSDKIIITRVLDMVEDGKIGILGSRISFLEFDQKEEIRKRYIGQQKNSPIQVQCSYEKEELIVLTKGDVRSYDLKTGSLKSIFCQYHSSGQEITVFKYVEILNKFYLANQKGQLSIFCSRSGKLHSKHSLHSSTISFLEYDQNHKLMISGGYDSNVNVGKECEGQWNGIRQMRGCFGGKEISVGAVSIFHNLIAIGSNDASIFIWDYEYARIVGEVKLPAGVEPTCLTFLPGYSLLLIGTTSCNLYVFRLQPSPTDSLRQLISLVYSWQGQKQQIITHTIVDVRAKEEADAVQVDICKIYAAGSGGWICKIQMEEIVKKMKIVPTRNSNITYNPERQLKETFAMQTKKKNYDTFILSSQQINTPISPIILQAHNAQLTSLHILEFDNHLLVTSALDSRIKVWSSSFKLVADININLPLPYKWEMNYEQKGKIVNKILFGLKLIHIIFKKFGKDISIGESKALRVQNLLVQNDRKSMKMYENSIRNEGFLTQPPQAIRPAIYLFQEEFSKKDLHYNLVKKYNFHEIAGPSLKQIEFKKKIELMQKEWQVSKEVQEEERSNLLFNIQNRAQKNEEKQMIMSILKEKPFAKRKEKQEDNIPPALIQFNDQLDFTAGFNEGKFHTAKSLNQSIRKTKKDQFAKFIPKNKKLVEHKKLTEINFKVESTGNSGYSGKKITQSIQSQKQTRTPTFQSYYFDEKRKQSLLGIKLPKTAQDVRHSLKITPRSTTNQFYSKRDQSRERSDTQEGRKDFGRFRAILKDMNEKVKQSKKSKVRNLIRRGVTADTYYKKQNTESRQ